MDVRDTIHILPTSELAERVLIPGDPGRALAMAQSLIEGPRMFNHNRGLWGYTGPAIEDSRPLTIQASGMGGPSLAIVVHELVALGARRLVRVGTCGSLQAGCELGDLVVAPEAICADGTSRALGAGSRASADPELTDALKSVAGRAPGVAGMSPGDVHVGTIVSTDLFYEPGGHRHEDGWRRDGAIAVEMECSTLFTLGASLQVQTAAVMIVSDVLFDQGRVRIAEDALIESVKRLGQVAIGALAAVEPRRAGGR